MTRQGAQVALGRKALRETANIAGDKGEPAQAGLPVLKQPLDLAFSFLGLKRAYGEDEHAAARQQATSGVISARTGAPVFAFLQ